MRGRLHGYLYTRTETTALQRLVGQLDARGMPRQDQEIRQKVCIILGIYRMCSQDV